MDIKKNRLKLKMTQVEVAKAVGVSLPSFQLWEREVSKPNPENLEKLIKVLKIDKQQICYKSNEPCNHNCSGLCKESC